MFFFVFFTQIKSEETRKKQQYFKTRIIRVYLLCIYVRLWSTYTHVYTRDGIFALLHMMYTACFVYPNGWNSRICRRILNCTYTGPSTRIILLPCLGISFDRTKAYCRVCGSLLTEHVYFFAPSRFAYARILVSRFFLCSPGPPAVLLSLSPVNTYVHTYLLAARFRIGRQHINNNNNVLPTRPLFVIAWPGYTHTCVRVCVCVP